MTVPGVLLSHLASQLKLPAEVLATEALSWVLQDASAATGLAAFLRATDSGLPDALVFRHQTVATDGSRPDLVGYDGHGHGRLIVEVKFNAGLMATQPAAYLQQARAARDASRTAGDEGDAAMVLFVVPQQRLDSLWPIIAARAAADWPGATGAGRQRVCEPGLHLQCVTWSELLAAIEVGLGGSHAPTAGQPLPAPASPAMEGLRQLRGLVAGYETAAFSPLESQDVTDRRFPTLWMSLTEVIRGAVEAVVADPAVDADKKNLTYGWSSEAWGMFLRLAGLECLVWKHAENWRQYGQTPLWLSFNASKPENEAWVRRALHDWQSMSPPRLVHTRDNNLIVPLTIPVGADREECVAAVAQQLRTVATALAGARA